MKILKHRERKLDYHEREFVDDIDRICKIALSKEYILSPHDAKKAWEAYSEDYAAGWMILSDNDEDVWKSVFEYLDVVE